MCGGHWIITKHLRTSFLERYVKKVSVHVKAKHDSSKYGQSRRHIAGRKINANIVEAQRLGEHLVKLSGGRRTYKRIKTRKITL